MKKNQDFKNGNMSLLYIIIAAVIVIGGIAWFATRQGTMAPTTNTAMTADDSNTNTMMEDKSTDTAMTKDGDEAGADKMQDDVLVVNVKGSPFKFEPNEITVKKGQKVKVVFMNEKGMHDWVNDEFNVHTKQVQAGETDSVEFTADKVGTFEYYCSVGDHRAMGMKGNLIVE